MKEVPLPKRMDNNERHEGVWIPESLWKHPSLSWMEKCLAAEISSLSSAETGPCDASCQYLAQKMQTSPGALRVMLSRLMDKGVIWQLGSDGRHTWRCVVPEFSADQSKYKAWLSNERLGARTKEMFERSPVT